MDLYISDPLLERVCLTLIVAQSIKKLLERFNLRIEYIAHERVYEDCKAFDYWTRRYKIEDVSRL